MRIKVTQEHIDKGVSGDMCACPVALAIEERIGERPVVWGLIIKVKDVEQYVAAPVGVFISRFDEGLSVKPFSFNLKI